MSEDAIKYLASTDWPARAKQELYPFAHRYNDIRGYAFPSLMSLAQEMGITKKGIIKKIKRLEANGYLSVDIGGKGPGSTNRYRLVGFRGAEPTNAYERVNSSSPKGELSDVARVNSLATKGEPFRFETAIEEVVEEDLEETHKKTVAFGDKAPPQGAILRSTSRPAEEEDQAHRLARRYNQDPALIADHLKAFGLESTLTALRRRNDLWKALLRRNPPASTDDGAHPVFKTGHRAPTAETTIEKELRASGAMKGYNRRHG